MTPDQIEQTLNEWDVWVHAFYEGRRFLPTASVFVWDPFKKCLILVLTKNAKARAKKRASMSFKPPQGGHHQVEDHHSIVETAVREVGEELGIPAQLLKFVAPLHGPVPIRARVVDREKLKKKGFKDGKVYFGFLFTLTNSCRLSLQKSEIAGVRLVHSRKEWQNITCGNRPQMRHFLNQCLKLAEKTGVVKFTRNPKGRKQKKKK